jgi:hypothetical protein
MYCDEDIWPFAVLIGIGVLFGLLLANVRYNGPTNPAVMARNVETLAGPGTVVGALPDGRQVRVYKIDRGAYHDHYVYVIDGAATASNNFEISEGKNRRLHTTVTAELEPAEQ